MRSKIILIMLTHHNELIQSRDRQSAMLELRLQVWLLSSGSSSSSSECIRCRLRLPRL